MDEIAPNRLAAEQIRQFGMIEKPIRVPGSPVRVVAVDDAVHDVVRLPCLVEKVGDGHAVSIRSPARISPLSRFAGGVNGHAQRSSYEHDGL